MTDDIRHFASWRQVPKGTYLTKKKLAELNLPRVAGPVRATVDGYDWRNRKAVINLYLIDESTPSRASAAKLASARAGKPDAHLCTDCGAHPDLPVTVYLDGDRLCQTCTHIQFLRHLQAEGARAGAHTAARAAKLLSGRLAIVHCELVHRGTTPSGALRSPAAVRAVVIDQGAQPLTAACVRLVGPRSKGIPDDAQSADAVGRQLRDAFTDRTLISWRGTGLADLTTALRGAGWTDAVPSAYGDVVDLCEMTRVWRADLGPTSGAYRPPVPPGRADRMLYLLQQMAADAPAAEPGGEPR